MEMRILAEAYNTIFLILGILKGDDSRNYIKFKLRAIREDFCLFALFVLFTFDSLVFGHEVKNSLISK